MKSRSYQNDLIDSLKDPREASEYLNAAIEEKDIKVFLLALRNVIEAYGGVGKLSKKSHLNRENLYRMLSNKGNPEIASLEKVLEAVGLRIAVEVNDKTHQRHHRLAA